LLAAELGVAFEYWRQRLVARLAGLRDAEYLWEPVDGCWSVRPGPDGGWRADVGVGGGTWTPVTPPPLTTIAWRMWHLGASPAPTWPPVRVASAREFADGYFRAPPAASAPGIGTAAEAVAALERHWTAVAAVVTGFEDEELLQPIGPVGGPYASSSVHALVLHVADEFVHHGAEVALLRDLYARGAGAGGG
jgi:hypothetical protein